LARLNPRSTSYGTPHVQQHKVQSSSQHTKWQQKKKSTAAAAKVEEGVWLASTQLNAALVPQSSHRKASSNKQTNHQVNEEGVWLASFCHHPLEIWKQVLPQAHNQFPSSSNGKESLMAATVIGEGVWLASIMLLGPSRYQPACQVLDNTSTPTE
jgi:hypothetical protein